MSRKQIKIAVAAGLVLVVINVAFFVLMQRRAAQQAAEAEIAAISQRIQDEADQHRKRENAKFAENTAPLIPFIEEQIATLERDLAETDDIARKEQIRESLKTTRANLAELQAIRNAPK